jgi:acyl-coenzyme A thioesterase PaaI-like protein
MKPYIVQEYYPDKIAVCYGCGRHNADGLHIETIWDGREGVCHFTPPATASAYPGIVYGGLLANLIDCHSIGTAVGAMYQAQGRAPGNPPPIICVTANLNVDYLQPTPLGSQLTLRAQVERLHRHKAVVACTVYMPNQKPSVRGQVVAVRVPFEALAP